MHDVAGKGKNVEICKKRSKKERERARNIARDKRYKVEDKALKEDEEDEASASGNEECFALEKRDAHSFSSRPSSEADREIETRA